MGPRTSHPDCVDAGLAAVIPWRRQRLEQAGFDAALADKLASDRRTDIHALLELIDHGCPPGLAARILAPFDREIEGTR